MFKKNPNRPEITIPLKKVNNGYKIINNDAVNPFTFKRITRAVFRCTNLCYSADLYQGSHQTGDPSYGGLNSNASIVQPPLHITIPAFSRWFDMDSIH